jgi:hypothetical protein
MLRGEERDKDPDRRKNEINKLFKLLRRNKKKRRLKLKK